MISWHHNHFVAMVVAIIFSPTVSDKLSMLKQYLHKWKGPPIWNWTDIYIYI